MKVNVSELVSKHENTAYKLGDGVLKQINLMLLS